MEVDTKTPIFPFLLVNFSLQSVFNKVHHFASRGSKPWNDI